jgi:hypothetical protein
MHGWLLSLIGELVLIVLILGVGYLAGRLLP